jgi:GR25 family glycosyltransferase involved in LPS biosynthesis
MSLEIEKIYLTHHSPLRDRRERLEKYFQKNKMEVEWVETETIPEGFYKGSPELWNKKLSSAYPYDSSPPRKLSKQEISIAIKHYECFKRIANSPHEENVVLEDDVFFGKEFESYFNRFLSNTPNDWELIFFGSGAGLHIPRTRKDVNAYRKDDPVTRCLDSYIIKKSVCERVLSDLLPITLPIDFELSYSLKNHKIISYWWEPSLTMQGSQNDIYKSAIPH